MGTAQPPPCHREDHAGDGPSGWESPPPWPHAPLPSLLTTTVKPIPSGQEVAHQAHKLLPAVPTILQSTVPEEEDSACDGPSGWESPPPWPHAPLPSLLTMTSKPIPSCQEVAHQAHKLPPAVPTIPQSPPPEGEDRACDARSGWESPPPWPHAPLPSLLSQYIPRVHAPKPNSGPYELGGAREELLRQSHEALTATPTILQHPEHGSSACDGPSGWESPPPWYRATVPSMPMSQPHPQVQEAMLHMVPHDVGDACAYSCPGEWDSSAAWPQAFCGSFGAAARGTMQNAVGPGYGGHVAALP